MLRPVNAFLPINNLLGRDETRRHKEESRARRPRLGAGRVQLGKQVGQVVGMLFFLRQ